MFCPVFCMMPLARMLVPGRRRNVPDGVNDRCKMCRFRGPFSYGPCRCHFAGHPIFQDGTRKSGYLPAGDRLWSRSMTGRRHRDRRQDRFLSDYLLFSFLRSRFRRERFFFVLPFLPFLSFLSFLSRSFRGSGFVSGSVKQVTAQSAMFFCFNL